MSLREEIMAELNSSSWYAERILLKVAEAVEKVENP